jgi:hypothetical protein
MKIRKSENQKIRFSFSYCFKRNSLLILLIALSTKLHSQQPFGVVVIKNCYQIVTGDLQNTTTFNFIDAPEGRDIFLTSTNPLDINELEISHSNDGINWNLDNTIPINSNYTLDPNFVFYKINPIRNPGTIGNGAAPVILNYIKPEFTIKNHTEGPTVNCVTFNSQNLEMNFPKFDGLCAITPYYSLKLNSNDPTSGLPYPFSKNFEITDKSFNLNIPPSFCNQQILDTYGNIVSPCLNFDIEVLITPCPHCLNALI